MNAEQLKERLKKGVKLRQISDLKGPCDRLYEIISVRTRDVSLYREGATAPVYLSFPKTKHLKPILEEGCEVGFTIDIEGSKGELRYLFVNQEMPE